MNRTLLSPPRRRFRRSRSGQGRSSRYRAALLALLASITAGLLATLPAGHSWNGDFALFLMHAQNLVAGTPYAETPYVLNGINGDPSPAAYPPGFPLLLAPLVAMFGTAVLPMKVLLVGCFVLALGVLALLLRDALPPAYVLAVVALVGLNPVLTAFLRTDVVSDLPFLLFLCLSLWVLGRGHAAEGRRALLWAGGGGLLMYATTLVRSLGLVLLPTLVLYDLARQRRITRGTWVTLGVFGAAYGAQALLAAQSGAAPGGGAEYYTGLVQDSLLDRLAGLGGAIVLSIRTYAQMVEGFFWGAETGSPALQFVLKWLGNATVLLVVGGWAVHAWRRRTLIDAFTPLYVAALLPWNFHAVRYLIPVLPFLAFYAVYALSLLPRGGARQGLLVGLALLVMGSYGAQFAVQSYGPGPKSALTAEAGAMYHYLRTATPPDALVVFGKPRFIALKTGRPSMRWYGGGTDAEYLRFFAERGVDYAVDGPWLTEPQGPGREPVVEHLAATHPDHFQRVYHSSQYVVYRFRPPSSGSVGAR